LAATLTADLAAGADIIPVAEEVWAGILRGAMLPDS
jgi:hypothetical protein